MGNGTVLAGEAGWAGVQLIQASKAGHASVGF